MNRTKGRIPNVLSIAGSDPSGGAGIQADLKVFAALDCHGMAAITALTAQNTLGVSAVHTLPAGFVAEQIRMVLADIDVAAIKVGMLGASDIVVAVAETLRAHASIPIVVDPVLVATTGALLGDDDVVDAMRRHLVPLATLVTPNLAEAAKLAEADLPNMNAPETNADAETIGRALQAAMPTAWLIKGGHAASSTADDCLLVGGEAHWFSSPRIGTRNTHGTGCTLSSAIASFLARGFALRAAIAAAKTYLDAALAGAERLTVGRGAGPLDHFASRR